jgi:3,4-dihydroxy-9,10-secoandrosta-1,3,5(10)-triene-9,17-dione 4,5-dioxygenase
MSAQPSLNPPNPRVRELSYVVVDTRDTDAWDRFATAVLGMATTRAANALHVKMDGEPHRFVIRAADTDGVRALGWWARGPAELKEIEQRLRDHGRKTTALSSVTQSGRAIRAGFSFTDDLGVTHEVFDAMPVAESPFSGGEVTGYVTGDQGVGHVVFIDSVGRCDEVFIDCFGMVLREDIITKVGGRGHFYGCNPRHHSAAAVDGPNRSIMHIMLEMKTVDDVGCALDRAIKGGWSPRTGLGRHRTDHMMSFYIPSPSGFDFEIGCNGLRVDDATWADTKESTRLRVWGHAGLKPEAGKGHG